MKVSPTALGGLAPAALVALLSIASCDESDDAAIRARAEARARAAAAAGSERATRPVPSATPGSLRAIADALEDGGAVEPAPASGDLTADLAHFTTLDACVNERHLDDPVLGDAVLALGYDGFARDACRVLAAAKSGRAAECRPITVSSLARHCESLVAIVGKAPDACPRDPLGPGREPSCVALAARDRRLCASVREDERARCEALLTGDEKRCGGAPRAERQSCVRDVARLRGLLKDAPRDLAPFVAPAGAFKIEPRNGAPMRGSGEGSLALALREGLLVTVLAGTVPVRRVELGTLIGRGGDDRVPLYASADPGVFAVIDVAADGSGNAPKAAVQRLDLVVPGGGTYSAPPTPSALAVTVKKLDATRGGVVELTVDGSVGDAERTYGVHLDAKTFVRDVVTVEPRPLPTGSPRSPALKPR